MDTREADELLREFDRSMRQSPRAGAGYSGGSVGWLLWCVLAGAMTTAVAITALS